MKRFIITFGQASPLRDHWIEILAPDEDAAREYAHKNYPKWSMCYDDQSFNPEYFPGGRKGQPVYCNPLRGSQP